MGCGSCGVADKSGKTSGCGSSGGCSSGGCNRVNVYDWFADLPQSDFGKPFPIFEASFNKGSRKEFFLNNKNLPLEKGTTITVEGTNGFDVAKVSLTGELVKLQLKKYGIKEEDVVKKLLHTTLDTELEIADKNKQKEKETLVRARAIARTHGLDMKIGETEIQADGKKISIFYTANNRVDFRELIKLYAQEFNARIEMKQIGARQESAKVGGIGSCGRELCCSTWLTDFKTVYTSAARYQNLSINQTKLSGQCGKLKCCLNYELDTYMDALANFPNNADSLMMKTGKVKLVKKDIFKGLMWYAYENNSKYYPLSITRVKEIQELNTNNIFPDELEPVEIIKENKKSDISIDAGFVNDVGQITLTSLMKKKRPSKNKPKNPNQNNNQNNNQGKNTGAKPTGNRPAGTKPAASKSAGPRKDGTPDQGNPTDRPASRSKQQQNRKPRNPEDQKPKNEQTDPKSTDPNAPPRERRNSPKPRPKGNNNPRNTGDKRPDQDKNAESKSGPQEPRKPNNNQFKNKYKPDQDNKPSDN